MFQQSSPKNPTSVTMADTIWDGFVIFIILFFTLCQRAHMIILKYSEKMITQMTGRFEPGTWLALCVFFYKVSKYVLRFWSFIIK